MSKKAILLILDGVGMDKNKKGNAVVHAKTPILDSLVKHYPHTNLQASGEFVGLPKGQMGNSEVGHLNIGTGRIIYTGLSVINKSIEDKAFFENKSFVECAKHTKKFNSKLHLIGLVSNGGVHSSLEHLIELIKFCGKNKLNSVLHIITDGRDVGQKSFLDFYATLNPILLENNVKIGSIAGRFYAMDRDKNWERTKLAYETLIGSSKKTFSNLEEYIDSSYKENVFDEFILPAINANYKSSEISINDNDAIINFNFRPDRARQISHLIFGSDLYDKIEIEQKNNLYYVTLMKYEGIKPSSIAFPPLVHENVLGKIIEENNLKQLRIAETEKYAHVTFFFDGGEEINFKNEEKILVASPKVLTYDEKPEMSALEITEKLIAKMPTEDVIICNFANGDMVGHTGNFDATIKAIEFIDEMVGKIFEAAKKNNFTLFITADHGNADKLIDDNNNIVTSHTTAPVPFIITDENVKITKNKNNKLANIAPSLLQYLGIEIPKEMANSIIKN